MKKKQFVQVRGTSFVKNGTEMYFNGIGIGSWLNMEHFMLGIPGTDSQIRHVFREVMGRERAEDFFDRFVYSFITGDDFRFLKEHKINLVRVPFNYRLFIDDQDSGTIGSKGFRYLDYLMEQARKYEIYVLLDLHTVPGGQNPDWHSDNGTGYTEFWEYDLFRQQIVGLWKKIATYYSGEEYLLGYDILNEPCLLPQLLEGKDDLQDMATGISMQNVSCMLAHFYQQVIDAVRCVDPVHIIFLEGDHFASDFDCLSEIHDDQLAMEFHFYPTVWYPDLYDEGYDPVTRREKFEEVMRKLIANAGQYGKPVLCGEAGYEIATNGFENTFPLIRDTLELFHQYKISFTLWSYKDAGFMGMVMPAEKSPWMELKKKVSEFWTHHRETEQAEKTVKMLCADDFPQASRADRYVLTFRQRALLYPMEEKYILKPLLQAYDPDELMNLPDSFLFADCVRYDKFAALFDEIQ